MPDAVRTAPGSFRDPQGQVVEYRQRIFRAMYAPAAAFPETWSDSGPLADFVAAGKIWPGRPLRREEAPPELLQRLPGAVGFLEHPRLAPITYPYEWPFRLLKRAALLHLELHRAILKRGLTFADGYAYNVQFVGSRPVFLDSLAFVPYVEGQPWAGYSQFCESFLNPLLLAHNGSESCRDAYRGRLRGVTTRETARQLGWFGALRAGAFMHVIVNSLADARGGGATAAKRPAFSRAGLDMMLASLERAIHKLELPTRKSGGWSAYESNNSYSAAQKQSKHTAVQAFIARTRPDLVLDIGCNAGEYSEVALQAGAGQVVGLERDDEAVNRAVLRADSVDRPFLPLQIDIQNPSPAQGWDCAERQSLRERLKPDALLCLALIHHLVLGEGLPLDLAVPGIVSMAPAGIIEFVPPDDPMARRIAGPPERLTHRYDLITFLAILSQSAHIVGQNALGEHGRVLVEYRR
jgi:SAM-dependent methyltransferase